MRTNEIVHQDLEGPKVGLRKRRAILVLGPVPALMDVLTESVFFCVVFFTTHLSVSGYTGRRGDDSPSGDPRL